MNTSALEDIQKALNAIRGDIERVDADTKLAALELIMGTSQSILAMARKLTTPKAKTRTVIAPKGKVIKAEPRQKNVSKKDLEPRSIERIKPKRPLPNQRVGEGRMFLETDRKRTVCVSWKTLLTEGLTDYVRSLFLKDFHIFSKKKPYQKGPISKLFGGLNHK